MRTALPDLPAAARDSLEAMQRAGALGASRTIRQINDLLALTADTWEGPPDDLARTLRALGDYFIATRGLNTPAIANAINIVLQGVEDVGTQALNAAQVRAFIRERRDHFNARSLENARRMAEIGANLLDGCSTVLPFDYSSTMLAILRRVAERGRSLNLIVPESRVLDGGRPIVREATEAGHRVTYIVDMAFGAFLPQVDAVLVGAESFQSSGDAWNTVGTYPIALAAERHAIPFYVATELIKIDIRSFEGVRKAIQPHDYAALLGVAGDFPHGDAISAVAPELDATPARYITAYITEVGLIPAAQIYSRAREFAERAGLLKDQPAAQMR